MAVEISQDAIKKLMHDSEEIRMRALDQIESKFVRASAHQLKITFKPAELCKELIRLVKHNPKSESSVRVLELLKRLLNSTYGAEVLKIYDPACLKNELYEIKKSVIRKPYELKIVNEIHQILTDREKRSSDFNQSNSELLSLLDNLSINTREENVTTYFNCEPEDYEVAWSNPCISEYNALKVFSDTLTNANTTSDEKENVLLHLQNTMKDYPAEYMLQSPHLFFKMLQLSASSQEHKNGLRSIVSATLLLYIKALRERLIKHCKIDSYSAQGIVSPSNSQGQNNNFYTKQLKVSKAMELLLEKCFEDLGMEISSIRKEIILTMEIVTEILKIVKIQNLFIKSRFLKQADQIRTKLHNMNTQDDCFDTSVITIARTKYIWLTFILLEMAETNTKFSQLDDQYKLFIPQLIDFSLQLDYPTLFSRIKKLIFDADDTVKQSYQIQILKSQLEIVVKILKKEFVNTSEIICQAVKILPILDVINSVTLIEIIFNSILKAIPSILSDHNLKDQALLLLRNLTALNSVNLKSFIYKNIAKSVKSHFAALMNNVTVINGVQNRQLLSASVLGIPMDKQVLQQIIYTNYESKCPKLRKSAEDIILLQIKSYHFYGSSMAKYLEILSPLLPMLQCCTHSVPISETIFKLVEPDSNQFLFIDVLRCNIGFLFVNDISFRNEALTRLVFILNSVPQTLGYIPNIREISDALPNDLCIMQHPPDFGCKTISNKSYYASEALLNLLKILGSSNIGPQLRKTTLLQLNIMCNSWDCVAAFCEEQAYYLVLFALENSLKKDSSTDYIENVIPTIGILAKLLIYDKTFRLELEHIPNVYILLLLALFHFWKDVQLRQDASICLFVLVFGNIMAMPSGYGEIEAPKLLSNMNVPFKCKFETISPDKRSYFDIISNNMQKFIASEAIWKSYIRQVIAHSYFKSSKFSRNELEKMRNNLDICRSFLLEQHEAELMRATNYFHNIRFIMKTITNATDQKTVLLSIATMHLQLMIYQFEFTTLSQLPLELANDFFINLSKYLQVSLGNTADLQVYSCALEIFHLCVRFSFLPVTQNLKSMLRKDFFHCVIITLGNSELPLDVFLRLNEFHVALLEASTNEKCAANQIFKANLFEFIHNKILHFYAVRNLQQIRGLLRISKSLTSARLELPEEVLCKCSKTFIKLSINVTASTHTFAQWHHDCLVNFIQISEQLPGVMKTRVPKNFFNHIVGLCGHNNIEVRALSWICFNLLAKSALTGIKNSHILGTHLIASKLSHLPGGFISCCFNTFLDGQEVLLVRNLVGNLFVRFLNDPYYFEKALQFLEQQEFVNTVYLSLESYIHDHNFRIPNSFLKTVPEFIENSADINIMTSETIICFSRICIVLLSLRPKLLMERCGHPLLLKFFELLKLPIVTNNKSRYEMCAEICHLCTLCSKNDFLFLQRSVCHDDRWLTHLFALLDPPLNVTERAIVCVIQLILALCREEFVFHRLVESLANRLDVLSKLFCRAINVTKSGSALQRCTLDLVLHLLIKSQFEKEKFSFVTVLEKELDVLKWPLETSYHFETNNEQFNKTKKIHQIKLRNSAPERKISLSEIIIQELFTVFVHLYSSNSFKFDEPPGVTRIQVCEALSLLLKLSSYARQAAHNLKLLKKILLILEKFFDESENNNTILRRRYSESKKDSIIGNFILLFQVLLLWYSPTADVLTDDLQCFELSKVILKSWIWLEYSQELKALVLKLCSFLSEKSFPFCVQFSSRISSHSQSILELVFKAVGTETHKVRTNNDTHLTIVAVGLRVMMNCCACIEGRCVLVKLHALDVIEGFNPFNMKSPKLHQNVLHFWLQFYELFSRYTEGSQARNLNTLCSVINRFTPFTKMRLICLKILRNMCFAQRNRTILYASPDFIYTLNEIITRPLTNDLSDPASYEEKIILSVGIWQLISGGIKFVAMIRGTKLENNLRELHEKLLIFKEEDPMNFKKQPSAFNLSNILKIIVKIFDQN